MPVNPQQVATILNSTGAYLQARVFETLERGPFKIKYEYPFAINGKQGKADMIAVFQKPEKSNVLLSVEVKKADPLMKHWVFFPQKETQEGLFLYRSEQRFVQVSPPQEFYIKSWFPKIDNLASNKLPLYDVVYEVNENWQAIFKRQDNAEKAMSQANHGLSACFDQYEKIKAELKFSTEGFVLFIPLVVTSANLYETQFDPKDVSLENGEIDITKFKVIEKPWVAYNYALEDHLQKYLFIMKPGNPIQFSTIAPRLSKSITFVVNSNHFNNFITSLLNEIRYD